MHEAGETAERRDVQAPANEVFQNHNKEKTRTYQLREGVTFLGFEFKLTETGKVLKHIKQSNAKCNGDMHAALDYAAKVKHDQKEFLAKQGIHALYD